MLRCVHSCLRVPAPQPKPTVREDVLDADTPPPRAPSPAKAAFEDPPTKEGPALTVTIQDPVPDAPASAPIEAAPVHTAESKPIIAAPPSAEDLAMPRRPLMPRGANQDEARQSVHKSAVEMTTATCAVNPNEGRQIISKDPVEASAAPSAADAGAVRRRRSSARDSGPFVVVAHGAGGVDELRASLNDSEVMFGLLRSAVGSGLFARTKFVLVHFRGSSCPATRNMRVTARREEAQRLLGSTTVDFHCERQADATVDALLEVLQLKCVADDGGVPQLAALRADLEKQVEAAQAALRLQSTQLGGVPGAPGAKPRWIRPTKPQWSLDQALAKVRAPQGPANWILVDPALEILDAGGGSVEEMQSCLPDAQVAFGMVRLAFGSGRFRRCYWLFVHWTGPRCTAIKRGQANVQRGAANTLLQPANFSLFASARNELSAQACIDKVRRCAAVDEDLKGEAVDSVFSRQAFFDAVKEDQAALQAELDDDSPAAEPEPEPAPQLMSIDAAVKAVRDNEHPFNWLLMQVGEAAA